MSQKFEFDDEFASPTDYARQYRQVGLQVVPAYMPSEATQWKRPALEKWKPLSKEHMSQADFEALYGPKGDHVKRKNMGILTGRCSNGTFVLDLDTHKNDLARIWFEELLHEYNNGKPLETPTQTTGGGGKQLLFRAPAHWSAPTSKRPDLGIDIRGEGGFAMLPPSKHESGRCYEWDADLAPWEASIMDAPEWFLEEIDKIFQPKIRSTKQSRSTYRSNDIGIRSSESCEDAFGHLTNGREDYMMRLVCARLVALHRAGHPKPTDEELRQIFEDLWSQYESKVESRLKDYGLSKREWLEREGRGPSLMWNKLQYLRDSWNTKVSDLAADNVGSESSDNHENSKNENKENKENGANSNDDFGESEQKNRKNKPDQLQIARKTIECIGSNNILANTSGIWMWDIKGVWQKSFDDQIKKHIHRTLSRLNLSVTSSVTNSVLQVLKTEMFSPDHKFNLGNPETVNCKNGEIELQNGKWSLTPHRRELYRTTQIPVTYDVDAKAPRFMGFLDEIFRDDPDRSSKATGLLEMMGYTLVSHSRHEKFVVLIGAGANGKSVVLSILMALLGTENVAAVQPSNFDRAFQRAHLDQKLANIITEMAQGEIIADAELKAITSGEPSTVEHKYGPPFVMQPFATCWFGTNHMPRTKDFSEALFRRAIIITFNRVFALSEQDPLLKEKLREELPGILKLALDAYAAALVNGFTEPSSSLAAKQDWRREVDQVAQFVDECCEPDHKAEVIFKDLFHAYAVWATDEGVQLHMSQRGFRDRLSRLGYGNRRDCKTRYVTGLRLLAKTPNDGDFG